MPDLREAGAHPIPDDQILLRIVGAIATKARKREDYIARQWIRATDPFVVAENAGNVPSGKLERELPRIVRAVFSFGDLAVALDASTGQVKRSFHLHRDTIKKASGVVVDTALFETAEYGGVSACLYSTSDAFNPPRSPAGGLLLVHNPLAEVPLQLGSLNICEYWRDGGHLRSRQA